MTSTAESFAFLILTLVTATAALGAIGFRDIVHCGLSLALAFVGIAGFYILLGAEFIGFIQILVYVGAVAVLIMFVILLTRPQLRPPDFSFRQILPILPGLLIAGGVLAALVFVISRSPAATAEAAPEAAVSIETVGILLVSSHLLPLQITAVLLTAALIGGVLFALKEDESR